ncbi:acetate--CoA ligase family protein [Mumia sp. DW29H23]|uniref:acetate--CoA ligase family protein n=1 Tax=Mumia sp. DW29H23 TaxID=3421241 RepID=UPI003D68247B
MTVIDVRRDATRLDLSGLDSLFRPRSVAVLGASTDPVKIGGRPIRFLKEHGFAGPVYPINPRATVVQGLPAFASLDDVEGEVDLALIALPSAAVLDAVHTCGRNGVKVATIFSAGFAELGVEGEALQREVVEAAASYGMRILGPNCIGSMNRSVGAVGTFAAAVGHTIDLDAHARVALVSQSGAIAAHWVVEAVARGIDFDPWLSLGNGSDIQLADALAYLALDPGVDVIAVYLEGAADGDRLREALRVARDAGKPVVALKVGRSEVGAAAAASHTASLAGADQVFDALFAQYGVTRVESMAELLDVSYAVAGGYLPTGRRVGLMTGSGGVGILMADEAADAGLEAAPLPVATQARLKEVWPAAGVVNPVDLTAQLMNDPRLLPTFLDTVLDEGEYDAVVVALTYMGLFDPWTDLVVDALTQVRAKHPDAPIVVSMLSTPEVRRAVEALHIPVFEDASTAVRVLGTLADIGTRPPGAVHPVPALGEGTRLAGPYTEVGAKRLLADAGIPVVSDVLVTSAAGAARAAEDADGPVVLKVVSPDLAHKSDIGGVVLDVVGGEAAAAAYTAILDNVTAAAPAARIDGVVVSPMIDDGTETILGAYNDPTFGPVVMFGLGGVFVEVLKDVTYRLAPIGPEEAEEMIREIKGFAMLDGARGRPPADVAALADALSALSVFAATHRDQLDSIDVNPFLVRPRGRGGVAVDALVVLQPEADTVPRS